MVTVRFPTGLAIQYNDGAYLQRGERYTDVRDKQGGKLIAQVPNECIIEFVQPCRVYTSAQDPEKLADAFLAVIGDPLKRRGMWGSTLKKVKNVLRSFDARTQGWRS